MPVLAGAKTVMVFNALAVAGGHEPILPKELQKIIWLFAAGMTLASGMIYIFKL